MIKRIIAITVLLSSGCAVDSPTTQSKNKDRAPTQVPINVMKVADAVPKYEKRTRAGNPPEYEIFGKQYKILADSKGYQRKGIASWYGAKFHGKNTSNGEIYDMYAMTAAHKTLPIPSYVRVTNLSNKKSVVVRINDRGPFHENRVIDLSYTAAVKLGIQQKGIGLVEITALEAEKPINTDGSLIFSQKQGMSVYLQIGAFNNPLFAQEAQEKMLAKKITNSRIQVANKEGNQMYKVQIGPFYTDLQIDNINEKLVLLGYTDTELIIEKGI